MAAKPYLDLDNPPKRLLVGRNGSVSVVED